MRIDVVTLFPELFAGPLRIMSTGNRSACSRAMSVPSFWAKYGSAAIPRASSASPKAEQGGSILSVGDDTSTGTGGESATGSGSGFGSGSGPVLPLTSVDIPNLLTGLGL